MSAPDTPQGHAASAAPLVFDRPLARHYLERAARAGLADFLVDRVAEDLDLRLSAIKRDFSCALDLGGPGEQVRDVLRQRGVARVVRAPIGQGLGGDVVVDEEALPFAPESFDLIVGVLSLQGVNDLPGAMAQIRRTLKPDGLFIGCLPGGATLTELRQAFTQAEAETTGGVSPRVAPFADVRDMGALLQRAGFALPVADLESLTVRYGHPLRLAADLRAMGAGNALVDRLRKPLRRDTLMRMAEVYLQRFADPDGRVRATFELVWMSGWAPHESQQKPLRPGSAKARLIDALKVDAAAMAPVPDRTG
ncbi:methyltransferase [Camelimonas fluminis]|uniref:Methyltransferase domain-containing protein n=1 Tax=Camelimonas fluminis TaxID=1576911 RepID=A0ABV7ULR5_9HYPH|nr:methyltransferase domain-containing protein [Camelimonas fluminis]GHE55517.1 methyltransferase [Camelimonas fluminis]